tara:strand:- start:18071 stop:18922 length:852 start_codon:yes stop_codon:yes gene_type:complete
MVLESLLFPLKAEKKPWEMLFIGFAYSSIGILLALWIFKDQASLVMVFLIVLAAIPLTHKTLELEESKDLIIHKEASLLKEHNKAITFLMYMFLGITLSSVLWYTILPSNIITNLFHTQSSTIQAINNAVSGSSAQQFKLFNLIFFNNLRVLVFALLFSFVYSSGAIFILTWNATVIGTAIGNFIRSNIAVASSSFGFFQAGGYLHIVSLGLLRYVIHGVPEIVAYFYGGLAGGILSMAIIKRHYKTPHFNHILADFFELLLISVAFLLVAGFLEVYVTPIFF